jgi:HEAT repeat protein
LSAFLEEPMKLWPDVSVALLLVGSINPAFSAEPLATAVLMHQGRPVSYWLAALEPTPSIAPQPKQAEAEEAIHALGSDAIPTVLRFSDPNRDHRLATVRHACAILAPEGDPKLIDALHDVDAMVRETALAVLPKTVLPAALDDVIGLLSDPVRSVHSAAVQALVRLAPEREETVAALVAVLHDLNAVPAKQESELSREDAAVTLGNLGAKAKAAVPALVDLLTDPSEQMREAAAVALWRIEANTQGIPTLIDRLENARDYQTALRVMKVLAEMGPLAKSAVPVIRAKLDDAGLSFVPPTLNFGQAVVEAVAKIDPAAAGEARRKLAALARE